jgi:inward rectifier potassium channel
MSMSTPSKQDGKDLGFGEAFSEQRRQRLVNRDGTFNVWRRRKRAGDFISYAAVLQMRWPVFLLWIASLFVVLNTAFGVGFLLIGQQALAPNGPDPAVGPVWRALFFSVHTFTTIGYGNVVPVGFLANALVVAESFIGFLMYSLATGLLFARFTRPVAKIRFSTTGVIKTGAKPALLIRLTNLGRSELIRIEATVIVSFFDQASAHTRCYYTLELERSNISFMPLSWTLAHFIDKSSPFANMTEEAYRDAGGEILVQITAIDQVSSQSIHARASYAAEELIWNARYAEVYLRDGQTGLLKIDLREFDSVIPM